MQEQNKNPILNWIQNSITFKLISIAFLVLILLVPQQLILSIIRERANTMNDAIEKVSSEWSHSQRINGPVVNVPYMKKVLNEKNETVLERHVAHFLPETLNIKTDIAPSKKQSGIYDVVLYKSEIVCDGNFAPFSLKDWENNSATILWNEATLNIGISDLRGISEKFVININGEDIEVNPGVTDCEFMGDNKNYNSTYSSSYTDFDYERANNAQPYNNGITTQPNGVSINLKNVNATTNKLDFKFSLSLKGSKLIEFLPYGKQTNVAVNSSWNTPKYYGAFLPEHSYPAKKIIDGKWKITNLNRSFPQSWSNNAFNTSGSEFGVELYVPANQYQQTMRSAKYAILFVILTFLVFFFVELIYKCKVHPLQYLLVGLAITIFYLLLLSISEHLGFGKAYIIAAVSVVMLITLFTKGVVQQRLVTVLMFALLVVLYLFLYALLILNDYSLLIGSLGLFLILSVIMYLSRNIKWE